MTISCVFFQLHDHPRDLHSFPTRRSSDLPLEVVGGEPVQEPRGDDRGPALAGIAGGLVRTARVVTESAREEGADGRSEEHTSELQSQSNLVCRLLLEKKK